MRQHTFIKITDCEGNISCINVDNIVCIVYDVESDKFKINMVNGGMFIGESSDELKKFLELK